MSRMKRQDKYPETKTFHYYNANPKNRITGDCTFRAVCTALEQTWEQTVMEMAELSCKTGYAINDKKGIERYLKEKGWTKHSQPRKADNTKYTGKEFCEKLAKKNKRYVCTIGGHHIVAIVDKKVNDIWDSTDGCIGNYWTKE
jgi:hypothetical protein